MPGAKIYIVLSCARGWFGVSGVDADLVLDGAVPTTVYELFAMNQQCPFWVRQISYRTEKQRGHP